MSGMVRDRLSGHVEPSGATCVVVVRLGCTLYAANLGDSRAVLYDASSSQVLSKEHRPDSPVEKARISRQGLRRSPTGNSETLSLSNDPGPPTYADFHGKPLWLTEAPDLKIYPLDPSSPYVLVVGSDGLWDALSLEDVRDLVWDPHQRQSTTTAVRESVSLAVRRWTHGLEEPSVGVPDIACAVAGFYGDGHRSRPLMADISPSLIKDVASGRQTRLTSVPMVSDLERSAKPDM